MQKLDNWTRIEDERMGTLGGISILQAWKPGALARLMGQGRTLREAMDIAELEGMLVAENRVHNLVVSLGKNWSVQMLGSLQSVGIAYHAFGTSQATPALGDTQLGAEVGRMAVTQSQAAANVLTLDAYYVAAACNYHIYECGWFAGPAASITANSGVLISHYAQPYDNSGGAPNDLTFEYVLTQP